MTRKKPASRTRPVKRKTQQGQTDSVPFESLPSFQFLEGVLSNFGGLVRGGKRTTLDQAQEIMYDAFEAPTRKRAIALARRALEVSPDCADAYFLLAQETAESLEEAIDLYQKGVEAGERAIGKRMFEEDAGHFWGLLETRPYMRARAGLAQCLWEAGRREEAVEHYWDMLRLNPNDNQGIRDLLMPCLLVLGRDRDAERLFKQYEEDGAAVWKYSRVLLDFRRSGDCQAASKSLQAALEENRYVPSYLLDRRKMPRYLPDHHGFGDENEAVLYVHGNKAAWKITPGALEWLSAKVK